MLTVDSLTRALQDLNKRLSLPADIRIPDGYLEKLQLSSPPFDQPLSRRSRRASLVSAVRTIKGVTGSACICNLPCHQIVAKRGINNCQVFRVELMETLSPPTSENLQRLGQKWRGADILSGRWLEVRDVLFLGSCRCEELMSCPQTF